jgi:hypothetical protein
MELNVTFRSENLRIFEICIYLTKKLYTLSRYMGWKAVRIVGNIQLSHQDFTMKDMSA